MLTDVIVTVLIYNRCVIIMYFYIVIFKTVLKVKGKRARCVGNSFSYCFVFLRTPSMSLLTSEKTILSTALQLFFHEGVNCL